LGLGYYVKAVLVPIGILLLLILWSTLPKSRRSRLSVSLALFLVTSAPYAVAVSRRAGHATLGDVSELMYVWYTNRRDLLEDGRAWNGVFGSAREVLTHPPRILVAAPRTLEFEEPIAGTLPVWYEPTYWWAGFPVHFDLSQQIASIHRSLQSLWEMLGEMTLL